MQPAVVVTGASSGLGVEFAKLAAAEGARVVLIARSRPGLEALAPTIDALHDAVVTLSQVVNPLSSIADRIPLPGRRPRSRSSSRTVTSQRVIDADE